MREERVDMNDTARGSARPELVFGINADPFSWQLDALGLPVPAEHELFDLDAKALMRVQVRGLIPLAEVEKGQHRLARKIIAQVNKL